MLREEGEICRAGSRDSETKEERCSRGDLTGQAEGKTPQGPGRERVCTLPPELNNWALGQFRPWHHLPGKQGKDGSKVTRSHWEALSSRSLLGCPPSDLGYFGNCAARIQPCPPPRSRGQWLLTMTFSQGIVSLMSLLLGTSPPLSQSEFCLGRAYCTTDAWSRDPPPDRCQSAIPPSSGS